MHPILIRIGPLTIHTYGLLVAAGFLVGLLLAGREAKRQSVASERIMDMGFYILLAAIVGSRLLFVVVSADHYVRHPLDIFKIWEGGLVFYGGLLLAVPVAIWYLRRHRLDTWKVADIFAPSLPIGHAIGRLGCYAAGCCYGREAHGLPWAVTFSDPDCLAKIGVPLHPVQLYESVGEFLNFLILIALRRHQSFKGQLFWTYVLLYSMLRFGVEFFRGDEVRGFILSGISVSQGISIVTALAALVVMKRLSRKPDAIPR
ncbi:MAG TPA: prolipoprotein diacylglyceryl transferase [Thermodesulfovibrionales bacterium]|jgi:phosphatidylglycerol:prolipoprotein diacylglycerol transferase|nr:prolipoprotein diacylglyceryl transferase [Thermodesulfovibrionales bacterium]